MLLPSGNPISNRLVRKVHFHQCFRILLDGLEQLGEKIITYLHGQYEVVQLVVLVDIRKETADNHAEPVASDSPGSMFTR